MIVVCYHQADLDGKCSAALIDRHYGFKTVKVGVDYHLPAPSALFSTLQGSDLLFIVDFSFKPDVMNNLIDRSREIGFELILIDHHISSVQRYKHFGLPGILSTDTPACELVNTFFYPTQPTPLAVRLLADYDTWRREQANWRSEILPFQLGVRTYSTEPTNLLLWRRLLELDRSSKFFETILMKGNAVLQFQERQSCQNSQLISKMFLGVRPCYLTLGRVDSRFFGDLVNTGLCVSVVKNQTGKWTIHLYSSVIDVEKIARSYGGGGHKGAAGFVMDKCPFGRVLGERPTVWSKLRYWWIGG